MDNLIIEVLRLTTTSLIFWLLVSSFFAYICSRIAKAQNRDPLIAAVMGFIFGLIAVIIYLIAGKKED